MAIMTVLAGQVIKVVLVLNSGEIDIVPLISSHVSNCKKCSSLSIILLNFPQSMLQLSMVMIIFFFFKLKKKLKEEINIQSRVETHPPKQNSSPKTTEAITATSKVRTGRYTETNTGPARSITHVCAANDNAEATTPCNHQYAM